RLQQPLTQSFAPPSPSSPWRGLSICPAQRPFSPVLSTASAAAQNSTRRFLNRVSQVRFLPGALGAGCSPAVSAGGTSECRVPGGVQGWLVAPRAPGGCPAPFGRWVSALPRGSPGAQDGARREGGVRGVSER